MNRDYPLAPTPTSDSQDDIKKKTVEERISDVENNPRLNRRIEKKYGYNYDAALKGGVGPDESGHWIF